MRCCISCGTNQYPEETSTMRLPNTYSLEATIEKLRDGLAATSSEEALALLEKAVTKARDDPIYSDWLESTLLHGSTVEIRECLSSLATTSIAPETYRPITRTTMPSTALIVRSTPSCSMQLSPAQNRRTNNIQADRSPGSLEPTP